MEKKLLQLITVMREELGLYRALVNQLQKKTDLIVEGDSAAIVKSSEEERLLAEKIRSREDAFMGLCKAISEELGVSFVDFNLSKMIERLDHTFAHQLNVLSGMLDDAVSQVKKVTERNAILLMHHLSYVNMTAQLIFSRAAFYQSSGALSAPEAVTSHVSRRA